ncbi:hypothetical protein [Hyphobacterium sp.]|uniref:hypothetical protein n=1 Tax=Hyphobacterium sp. TaxID=2004662 RepID=UPI00374A496E
MLRRLLLLSGTAALIAGPTAGVAAADDMSWFPSEPPANATPGECYARVRVEPVYEPYTETITSSDAYETYDVAPPRIEERVEEYVRRDAGVRYVVHQPVYETVTENVLVRPAYTEYVVRPAVHETVTEQVMVREPRMAWQRGRVPGAQITRYDPETGEVWCLVEEPGEYRTVTRNVVVQPARIDEIETPAEYAMVSREVLVERGRVEEIPIPAEYDTYTVQVLTQPATVESRTVQGRSETITRYRLVSSERYEWRMMDCEEIELPNFDAPTVERSRTPMSYQDHSGGVDFDSHNDDYDGAAQSRILGRQ